jgi:HEXXH motif-containing protein
VLQPHTFNVPGLADIPSVVPTGVAYQWEVFEIAQKALQAMSQYDAATHRQFMESMRVIALKPESASGVVNTSCSRLPGAAVFTTYRHPLVLAEDFIHEFHHNRLFALEEAGDFLVADGIDPIRDEKFYSPWREDPRPFYGLFHAEYVFDRVLEFWLNVVTDKTLDEETRRFAECRVACLRLQLEMTTIQLRTFATFTEFGQRLFDEIESAVFDKSQKIDALGIDGDVPAWTPMTNGTFSPDLDASDRQLTVAEVLQRHVERFDTFERCRSAASR